MIDAPEFAKDFAVLRALRNSPPPHIGEQHIAEYDGIVDRLQISSGHGLQQFRISKSEMEHPPVSFNPRTGHVQRGSVLRCPPDLFLRRLDGLILFLQPAQPVKPSAPLGSKDYWAMPDHELEQLAAKLHIPSIGRAGARGQNWYTDRQGNIDELVKRDAALLQHAPPPSVVQVVTMTGSNIQQGAAVGFANNDAHASIGPAEGRPWFKSARAIIEAVIAGLLLLLISYEIKIHF